MDEIAEAMRRQFDVAETARADAQRSERFTRIMAWSSLGIAVASLGAAIAAVIMSIQRPECTEPPGLGPGGSLPREHFLSPGEPEVLIRPCVSGWCFSTVCAAIWHCLSPFRGTGD